MSSASPKRYEDTSESSDDEDYQQRKYEKAERTRKRYFKWLKRQDDKLRVWRNVAQWPDAPADLREQAADYANYADDWLRNIVDDVQRTPHPLEAMRAVMQDQALERKLRKQLTEAKGGDKLRLRNQLKKLQAVLKDEYGARAVSL